MMLTRLLPACAALLLALSLRAQETRLILPPTGPDQAVASVLRDVRAARRQAMAEAMALDLKGADAKTFWSLYDPFDREMSALIERHLTLVRRYAEIFAQPSPAQVDQLVEESVALEAAKSQLRKRCYAQISQALSPRTGARFYMVDLRTERLIEARIAQEIPVISSK